MTVVEPRIEGRFARRVGAGLEVKVAHLLERLRQKFEHLKELRVLDVGCGVARCAVSLFLP